MVHSASLQSQPTVIDPLGQVKVMTGRDYCFRTCCPSVRPSVPPIIPTFQIYKNKTTGNNVRYWHDYGSGRVDHWWHLSCLLCSYALPSTWCWWIWSWPSLSLLAMAFLWTQLLSSWGVGDLEGKCATRQGSSSHLQVKSYTQSTLPVAYDLSCLPLDFEKRQRTDSKHV